MVLLILTSGISFQIINQFQDEAFTSISNIINYKKFPRNIFAIALNLFHYYTYFKSFKNIDRAELSLTCVFLAHKIKVGFIRPENINDLYPMLKSNINKEKEKDNKIGSNKNNSSKNIGNILDVEMEFLNFLGFDLEIENPYNYVIHYKKKFKFSENIEILSLNIITDSFRRPFCIYFHPRTIAFVAIFLAMMIYDKENQHIDLRILISKENKIIKEEFEYCFDCLFKLFESKIIK